MMNEQAKTAKAHGGRFGYGVFATSLMLITICILFFAAWFVHWSTENTRTTINATNKEAESIPAPEPSGPANATSFGECERAKDSKILQTDPEQCAASNGGTFTGVGQPASTAP
jgi:hypothetical protein